MDRKKFIEIMDKHIHDHEDVIINGFTFSEFDDYEIDYWNGDTVVIYKGDDILVSFPLKIIREVL